eukprot:7239457-Ditylum_brightwellii.AAC.1
MAVIKKEQDEAAPAKPVTTSGVNKQQRKYKPDTPMSKEEASSWRREQCWKQNHKSITASRQWQRDCITELKAEVEEWKAKLAAMMEKLRTLEEASLSQN